MRPVPAAVPGRGGPPAGPAGDRPSGPAGTRPSNRTDSTRPSVAQRLTTMATGFTALFLEVEAGRRPRAQLAPFLTPMLYARLTDVWVRGGAPGQVLAVRVAAVTPAHGDVVAVVRRGQRVGAISLHLSRSSRGWLVDDVALPELGCLPPPPYPVPAEECENGDDVAAVPLPVRDPATAGAPRTDWFHPHGTG